MRRLLIAWHRCRACSSPVSRRRRQQRIVAVVNDDVISAQDLNDRLQLVTLTSGIPTASRRGPGLPLRYCAA